MTTTIPKATDLHIVREPDGRYDIFVRVPGGEKLLDPAAIEEALLELERLKEAERGKKRK